MSSQNFPIALPLQNPRENNIDHNSNLTINDKGTDNLQENFSGALSLNILLYALILTAGLFITCLYFNTPNTQISVFPLDLNAGSNIFREYWKSIVIIIVICILCKQGFNNLTRISLSKRIFEKIKAALKRSFCVENLDHGLTEEHIINTYSTENHISPEEFRRNIVPLIKEMRKKDSNIRKFDKKELGKHKIAWQWENK